MQDDSKKDGVELTSSIWKRYGNHFLYVNRDRERVGSVNLKTGEAKLFEPDAEVLVRPFMESWVSENKPEWTLTFLPPEPVRATAIKKASEPASTPKVTSAPKVTDQNAEWHDLSLNVPGASAQKKADELRSQVPWIRRTLLSMLNVPQDWESWQQGANGERIMAEALESLGTSWRTLHSVPVGKRGSDIDHILIGPGGVLVVNTKAHGLSKVVVDDTKYVVNGSSRPYFRNSVFEADRVSKLLANNGLPTSVVGVIAIVAAEDNVSIKENPKSGIKVGLPHVILDWICDLPPALSAEQVDSIYGVLRRSSSWS